MNRIESLKEGLSVTQERSIIAVGGVCGGGYRNRQSLTCVRCQSSHAASSRRWFPAKSGRKQRWLARDGELLRLGHI